MKTTVKNLLKAELTLTMMLVLIAVGTITYVGIVIKSNIVNSYSVADNFRRSSLQIFTARVRGSAVYMSNGIALSAAHVCSDFIDGSEYATDFYGNRLKITEFETNTDTDICVLKVELTDELPLRTLADKKTFLLGQQVIVPGFQGGDSYSIFIHKVIGMLTIFVGRDFRITNLTDMYTAPGGSGGGVFDSSGRVIGIVSASSLQSKSTAIVPLVDIYNFLQQSPLGKVLVK